MKKVDFNELCHNLLIEADRHATETVTTGQGGPFGAILAVYSLRTGAHVRIDGPSANAVLEKGEATAHAEAEVLNQDNVQMLTGVLRGWKSMELDPVVILASSGQSCPACDARERTVAHYLINQKLLAPGRFVVPYGATFEDTAKIAGFNDLPYVLDFMRYADNPKSAITAVKHQKINVSNIPQNIREYFTHASKQIAVLVRRGQIISVAQDARYDADPISSAEVEAIRSACAFRKEIGFDKPWVLGDPNYMNPNKRNMATLYTNTPEIGPSMRAAAAWAAVNRIVSVTKLQEKPVTQEVSDLSNAEFLKVVAGGYHQPHSDITVLFDDFAPYPNVAQHTWRARVETQGQSIVYNGATGDDAELEKYREAFVVAFTGGSLRDFNPATLR